MSSQTRVKSLAVAVFTVIVYLYGLSIVIAAPCYNWQYARRHGLVDWLAWGEIAPTAKAFVWPYFAAQGTEPPEADPAVSALSQRQISEMQIMSGMRAIASALQANYIIDSRTPDTALTQEQVQIVIDYATRSLQSAGTTDEEALNRLYPEFGTRFKRDFCGGEWLLISGLTSNSRGDLVKSSDADRAWKDWYNPNRKRIENAFNAALQ
jgi:hypothetical protein